MKQWDTVAIIGVGLIGGSIGLALRSRNLAKRVVGIGRQAARLRKAESLGAVSASTTCLAEGVAAAQLVVVCVPVEQIVEHVRLAADACPRGALITDVGSTKQQIVASLQRALRPAAPRGVRFVGSHPMAGSERSGVAYAQADLFEGRVTIVTPAAKTSPRACAEVERFWRSLGARVLRRSPRDHDRAVAAISHLPHLVASALAACTPASDLPAVAGGWRDTTRVAAGDVELWRQILLDNRGQTLKALDKFAKVLTAFRRALSENDQARLVQLLARGKQHRDLVGN